MLTISKVTPKALLEAFSEELIMSAIFKRLSNHLPETKKNSGIFFQDSFYNYERFVSDIQDAIHVLKSEQSPTRFVFWHGKDYYSLLCLFFACLETKKFLLPNPSMKQLSEASEHIPFGLVFENFRPTKMEAPFLENKQSYDQFPVADGGLILATSGTTNSSRWALLSEKMLLNNAAAAIRFQELRPLDRILAFSSLSHTGGWNINLLPGILAGAEVHLIGRFSPYQSLKLLQSHTSVKTHLSPPQLNLWQNLKSWQHADLSSLQCLVTGSSEVWPHLVQQLLKKGVKQVLRNYGLTEAGPMIFCEPVHSLQDDMETYGTLNTSIKTLIDTEHRLLLQGDALFSGYLRNGLLTSAPTMWWDTGDLFIKKKHRLQFAGRAQDRIFINQQVLYPSIIEGKLLRDFPLLRECALVRQLGVSSLTLFYSTKYEIEESQLITAAEKAAGTKVQSLRCKYLPRNASGKIDRSLLRQNLSTPKGMPHAQI